MTDYNIKYTDSTKTDITVPEASINSDYDVIFPGRVRLEWGEEINESLLNLLENFACPEDSSDPHSPDINATTLDKLSNPVEGQLWFNSTQNRIYCFNGTSWIPYTLGTNDYGANWGQVNHGETLPKPVSIDGYEFEYAECIWSVSPFNYTGKFESMVCYSDPITSEVTMNYVLTPSGSSVDGIVNYLIVGIRNNVNLGEDVESNKDDLGSKA